MEVEKVTRELALQKQNVLFRATLRAEKVVDQEEDSDFVRSFTARGLALDNGDRGGNTLKGWDLKL